MGNDRVLARAAKLTFAIAFALTPYLLRADVVFTQTNLVSDVSGLAQNTDADLKNPWGVSFSLTSPFWISNQGSGTSTLYTGTGTKISLTVPIPAGTPPATGPTGQVFAGGSGFDLPNSKPAFFIFDTLNGTIDGWGGTNPAVQLASTTGATYTGLALANSGGSNYLYAADVLGGQIRVFNTSYTQVMLSANQFTDPNAMPGFVPFNIQLIGSNLFVTYANSTGLATGSSVGGYVDEFSTSGVFLGRVASGGPLNAPWGLALAPAGFGGFGGDLLVGNFNATGEIDAYKLNGTGLATFEGTLDGANGHPISNPYLWSLEFHPGGPNVNPDALYFTSGYNHQMDGLFGEIATPEPATAIPVGLAILVLALLLRKRAAGRQLR